MKRYLLLAMAWLFGLTAGFAQPDFDFDDCDCPMVDTPPVCAELVPGIVVALPSACVADCMGLTIIEGGDCATGWGGDFDWDDDYGDWDDDDYDWNDSTWTGGWDDDDSDDDYDWDWDDDYGWNDSTWTGGWDDDDSDDDYDWDWDDDYGWNDSTWTGGWDDDYGWSDSTWTGGWDDDYGWNDSTWTGDWDDEFDWTDSTWTEGPDFPGGGWTDSIDLGSDFDFDLLDSLLNDWLANGGQDIVDSLLNEMAIGDTLVFPPFPGDLNLDSLLASGDFSWLDSLLVGGGLGDFPWGDPGFPGGGLDSLLGDIDWNEVDSILNPGGLPWSGLDVDLDAVWEDKGPGEEFVNFGTGNSRNGNAWTEPQVDFQCYPVPANDRLHVQVSGEALRLELWSIAGQRLQEVNLTTVGTTAFDVAQLAAGTYFIRLQDEFGNWNQKTVVIQR